MPRRAGTENPPTSFGRKPTFSLERPSHTREDSSSLSRFRVSNPLRGYPVGRQLFILGSSQSVSTLFPPFLDAYATRLFAEPHNLPLRVLAYTGGPVGSILGKSGSAMKLKTK